MPVIEPGEDLACYLSCIDSLALSLLKGKTLRLDDTEPCYGAATAARTLSSLFLASPMMLCRRP